MVNSAKSALATRKAPTKKARGEDSKERVLDAAIAVLSDRGITQTSIQDIASNAGVAKGVVLYHFASKDQLLEQVLERACQRVEARVRSVFEQPEMPLERVRRAVLEMWYLRRDASPEFRVLSELHVLSRQKPELAQAFGRMYRRSRQQLVEVGFNELIRLGLKPKVPLDVAPRLLMALLDGLAMQHLVDPVKPEEEEGLLRALESVIIGLFEL